MKAKKYSRTGANVKNKKLQFFKLVASVKTDNFEGYFIQQKLMALYR